MLEVLIIALAVGIPGIIFFAFFVPDNAYLLRRFVYAPGPEGLYQVKPTGAHRVFPWNEIVGVRVLNHRLWKLINPRWYPRFHVHLRNGRMLPVQANQVAPEPAASDELHRLGPVLWCIIRDRSAYEHDFYQLREAAEEKAELHPIANHWVRWRLFAPTVAVYFLSRLIWAYLPIIGDFNSRLSEADSVTTQPWILLVSLLFLPVGAFWERTTRRRLFRNL